MILEFRHTIEQKKIAEHRAAKEALESEMETIRNKLSQLESGAPLESDRALEYSRKVRRQ